MILIKVNGGLGNQLQQYALYEKFKSLNRDVKLDISWFSQEHPMARKRQLELENFANVQLEMCTDEEYRTVKGSFLKKCIGKINPQKKSTYVETVMYDPSIFNLDNKILEGYWACEAYYADIMSTLRERLIFPKPENYVNIDLAKKMDSEESVSIHIRRGDYLNPENAAMFGNIATEEFYESAIAYIREHTMQPRFYVFSDDTEYVKEKYNSEEFNIVDWNHGADSYYDMYLMSHCKNNICANSTFSFWGARLNPNVDKIMIRPLKQKNTMVYEPNAMKTLWNGWILINQDGIREDS